MFTSVSLCLLCVKKEKKDTKCSGLKWNGYIFRVFCGLKSRSGTFHKALYLRGYTMSLYQRKSGTDYPGSWNEKLIGFVFKLLKSNVQCQTWRFQNDLVQLSTKKHMTLNFRNSRTKWSSINSLFKLCATSWILQWQLKVFPSSHLCRYQFQLKIQQQMSSSIKLCYMLDQLRGK